MKKHRADSADAAIKAMSDAAAGPLLAPDHGRLRDGDLPFWDGIVRARARDEWSENDLVIAAQLARVQADIERESALLDQEGTILTNERGTVVANARVTVLQQFAQRQLALMRSLRMGGRASGEAASDAARRRIQRRAEGAREDIEEEELLAV